MLHRILKTNVILIRERKSDKKHVMANQNRLQNASQSFARFRIVQIVGSGQNDIVRMSRTAVKFQKKTTAFRRIVRQNYRLIIRLSGRTGCFEQRVVVCRDGRFAGQRRNQCMRQSKSVRANLGDMKIQLKKHTNDCQQF